ncbi:MAG: iron ABC transporter permease [Sporomusaceae bacterium]|nr:iron ABC transporter permease [Sporomusaceae bacterium]
MSEPSRRFGVVLSTAVGLLAVCVYFSLSYGMLELSFIDVVLSLLGLAASPETDLLIFQFRLPRIISAALVGCGLGIAGTVLQGVSRNGLADPGILGINAGAGLAIVLFMFFFQGSFAAGSWLWLLALPLFGLIGGIAAALLTYVLARSGGRLESQRFLLTGIALGSGFAALTIYFSLKMNPADFQTVTNWTLGSLLYANWHYIAAVIPWFLLLLPLVWRKAAILDLFQLEESSVKSLGLRVGREQALLLLAGTGLVGAAVAIAGSIGFVGLIVPHVARRLAGLHHERVIPLSAVLGALLVVLADFIAKNAFAPVEIAVGVVISLIGVPYFVYLLFQRQHA